MAGQDLPSKEKTCRLQVSWRLNFLHSTMMKGMIENGARAGIKETYEVYREVGAECVLSVTYFSIFVWVGSD